MPGNQNQPEDPFAPPPGERLSSWFGDDAPKGFEGILWGADAEAAADKLGLACRQWTPWEGGGGYEACSDLDHPLEVLGARALVRFIRREGLLEGLSLSFRECGAQRETLIRFLAERFKLTVNEGTPYKLFSDNSAVRLDYDTGSDTCELTVTGPAFGKVYGSHLLGTGFRTFAVGFGPR